MPVALKSSPSIGGATSRPCPPAVRSYIMAKDRHWERKAKFRCEIEAIKLNKEERTLMDEGPAANMARDPSEEVPADAEDENTA